MAGEPHARFLLEEVTRETNEELEKDSAEATAPELLRTDGTKAAVLATGVSKAEGLGTLGALWEQSDVSADEPIAVKMELEAEPPTKLQGLELLSRRGVNPLWRGEATTARQTLSGGAGRSDATESHEAAEIVESERGKESEDGDGGTSSSDNKGAGTAEERGVGIEDDIGNDWERVGAGRRRPISSSGSVEAAAGVITGDG